MSLFADPVEHAANPPASWQAVKVADHNWQLRTAAGGVIGYGYRTRAAAEADKTSGSWVLMYEKEGRWYAGDTPPGMKPYAQVLAERERASVASLARKRDTFGSMLTPSEVMRSVAELPALAGRDGKDRARDAALAQAWLAFDTTAEVQTAATELVRALARAVRSYTVPSYVSPPQVLVKGAVEELLDLAYGEGSADLVDALLSWWRDLDDEEREQTGVRVLP